MTLWNFNEFEEALSVFKKHLVCFVCKDLMKNPYTVTECGHHFCYECIEPILGRLCECPQCLLSNCRPKNLRKSPIHRNLISWTQTMIESCQLLQSHTPKALVVNNNGVRESRKNKSWGGISLKQNKRPRNNNIVLENEKDADLLSSSLPTLENALKDVFMKSSISSPPSLTLDSSSSLPWVVVYNKNHTSCSINYNEVIQNKENLPNMSRIQSNQLHSNKMNGKHAKAKTFKDFMNEKNSKMLSMSSCTKDGETLTPESAMSLKEMMIDHHHSLQPGRKPSYLHNTGTLRKKGTMVSDSSLLDYDEVDEWIASTTKSRTSHKNKSQTGLNPTKVKESLLEDVYNSSKLHEMKEKSPNSFKVLHHSKDFQMTLNPFLTSCNKRPSSSKYFSKFYKFTILYSGLNPDQVGLLNDIKDSTLSSKNNCEIVTCYEPSVTHLIVGIDERGLCKRTLKYLMCILGKKHIVTFQWYLDSIVAGQWVKETEYYVKGDQVAQVTNLAKRIHVINEQLFKGLTFYFATEMASCYPNRTEMMRLVQLGGGSVLFNNSLQSPTDSKRAIKDKGSSMTSYLIVIMEPSIFKESLVPKLDRSRFKGYILQSSSWLLNSISCYELDLKPPSLSKR